MAASATPPASSGEFPMRNRWLIIGTAVVVVVLCVLFIRSMLLQIPPQSALTQFLDRHLPPLEKNKRRIVLLAPEEYFLTLAAGLDMATYRLLPLPRRFSPIDYTALSGFHDIWLLSAKKTTARPLEGSLFTAEKKAASPDLELSRLTLPDKLSFTDIAGSHGGSAYTILCPDGGLVNGFSLTVTAEGIASIAPVCRDPKKREKRERHIGDVKKGGTVTLSCPGNAPPTGLTLYTDKTIRGMALRCPTNSAVFDAAAIPMAGRNDLPGTSRNCPEGRPLRGIYGGAGALVDSLGTICAR